jgi:integrase
VATTPRDHLLAELLARTGQRQGVIRTLRWEQVNLEGTKPSIRFGPAKGGRYHELPIQRELLHDRIVMQRLTNPAPQDWVLPKAQGRWFDPGRPHPRKSA